MTAKKYEYYIPTADLACEVGLPDDTTVASGLLQNEDGDDFKLTLTLENLRGNQVRAIMCIVNALDGWEYTAAPKEES